MRNFTFAVLCGFSSLALAQDAHHQRHQHGHHEPHQQHQHHDSSGVDYSADFALAERAENVLLAQCWVRLLPATVPSAGYFIIHNEGLEDLELLAAATPSYDQVMLHETIEADGMTKMQTLEKILIPAQSSLEFKPGGFHIMYEQPTGALAVGSSMDLELLFSNKQKVTTTCKVNPAKARAY